MHSTPCPKHVGAQNIRIYNRCTAARHPTQCVQCCLPCGVFWHAFGRMWDHAAGVCIGCCACLDAQGSWWAPWLCACTRGATVAGCWRLGKWCSSRVVVVLGLVRICNVQSGLGLVFFVPCMLNSSHSAALCALLRIIEGIQHFLSCGEYCCVSCAHLSTQGFFFIHVHLQGPTLFDKLANGWDTNDDHVCASHVYCGNYNSTRLLIASYSFAFGGCHGPSSE